MKTIILSICFLISSGALMGQQEEIQKHVIKPKGSISETRLIISGIASDLLVEGTDRKDIEITCKGFEKRPERADGLRSLNELAAENTPVGLNVEFKGSDIYLMPASGRANNADYNFKIPKSMKLKVAGSYNSSDCIIKSMTNEVELNTQSGDMIIDRVTGPIVAKTMSGDIEVIFSTLDQKFPSSINSISGDIDITIASTEKGSFSISSISGEVFTDLDLKVKKTVNSKLSNADIEAELLVDVHEKLEDAMEIVEQETARIMKDMEKEIEANRISKVRGKVIVVPPTSPNPPQVPFHFNWSTPSGIGSKFEALLNGGGVEFNISSISGDVYLRKAE